MSAIGLLYPTPESGEDDFIHLASEISPRVDVDVIYFPWPDGADDLASLSTEETYSAITRLGCDAHLQRVLPDALRGHRVDAVAFAVTSSSFVHGNAGVRHQLDVIGELAGVPATSTTFAFQQAVQSLQISRVALASVYHPTASDQFIDRIQDCGVEVVARVDKDAGSDRELAGWSTDQIIALVGEVCDPRAEAVLLPETALHTAGIGDQLDMSVGVPVLTATQVTMWSACQLLDIKHPAAARGGTLFRT